MNATMIGIPFTEFIAKHDAKFNSNNGLESIFDQILSACTHISEKVNKAAIIEIFGTADKENIQGEEVMKLDVIANDLLIQALNKSPFCSGIASEEEDTYHTFTQDSTTGEYIVLFDPLDGSGNIDTNASIGTIFCVFRKKSVGSLDLEDFLQSGRDVVAAGYVIYGSSTLLVYSAGDKVQGFTLDPQSNKFLLSHPNIQTPHFGNQFSINYGNHRSFDQRIHNFVSWCTELDPETKRPFSMRYIGSMVADFHRNLIKGGIFMYPHTGKSPKGKLRLMYECIPLCFIQEQAGGKSTDNHNSILSIKATELHQRTPIAVGSSYLVDKYLNS